ncbi:hypothetical protein VFPFJ_10768 [Purpureocillium lilacinum]|nr:hypothetical protein VFPFJ_10768 [Purpureocillium lilacinum]KAK4090407.1 hypothetical protein Purlil1_5079 [Purpureocillium lilacinum]OAQ75778.1 hypothetical protein VFPFJ_10768 [Purpureocillium lilacinum]OAQ80569.1 hypothetical protein VFPBJ_06154 [Purpureocillium lilacinum]GJN74953.1 hypothetical protein PLICBS_009046 [Purpureocillium lilacinum]GJN85313.1 hypothetical protein PLIIFM63780_008880 [Purpureocillium lilacinum]
MHFATSATQIIVGLALTALPVAQGAISIGNQIREGGTHFNVAWIEGLSPCTTDVSIAPESASVCNRNFRLDGTDYYLVGCSGGKPYAQNPKRLRRVKDNSLYGTCSAVSKKEIDCKGNTHNVVKRYVCG